LLKWHIIECLLVKQLNYANYNYGTVFYNIALEQHSLAMQILEMMFEDGDQQHSILNTVE